MASASASKYFHITELTVHSNALNNFSEEYSLGRILAAREHHPVIQDARAELIEILMDAIVNKLTPRQSGILLMRFRGMTQAEIARTIGITQSAVHKSLEGNVDYSKKDSNGDYVRYGGSTKKLHRILYSDPRVLELLQIIAEHQNSD